MSTRESMRRDLRELAQLAEAKRKERQQDARSSGEWSYVDPAEVAATTTEPAPAGLTTPLASALPARPSNTTLPPAVDSIQAPGRLFAVEHEHDPRRGRSMIAGGAIAVALLTTLLTGRVLLHGAARPLETAAPRAAVPVATVATPEAPSNLGGSIATAAPNAGAPGAAESSMPQASPPAAHAAPSHATRHRGGAPMHAVTKSAPPATKASGGPQSLDDLIRKSVNDGAK